MESVVQHGVLLLNTWEYFLFTLFASIPKTLTERGNFMKMVLDTMNLGQLDSESDEKILDFISKDFYLHLLAKVYLFLCDRQSGTKSKEIAFFYGLCEEFLIDPVVKPEEIYDILVQEESHNSRT